MALRKKGVTFLICFRRTQKGGGLPQKRGWVPTMEETMLQCFCLAVLRITFLLFQDFIKYLYRQICIGCTTSQKCEHYKFFKGARMLVNINAFFCFTAATVIICINTSVHQIKRDCIFVTSTTQLQRHYVIAATLLIQHQHVNGTSRHHWNVKVSVQSQHVM